MNFYISATTDIGIKRKTNQDSLTVRKMSTKCGPMVFAVLCDGMGGLEHGEIASASVVRAFSDWLYTTLPDLSQRPLKDCTIRQEWNRIIARQNENLRLYGEKNGCITGTTVTALLLTEKRYFLLNIGDSRAYEIGSDIIQLTKDHTVVGEEIEKGNITPEQAERSTIKNVLTRCVGVRKTVCPDMFFGAAKRGTMYMLCSDGFRHCISKKEIKENLFPVSKKNISKMKVQEEKLIDWNKKRGETDNISVITVYAC